MGVKIQASIIFLGTGQGSFVIGRNLLSSGGFIIQVDDNQFHVDPGPNALKNAAQAGINVRANTALLVSHPHLNHSNDVNAVIDAMTYSGFDKKGVLVANKTVLHGKENYQTPLIPYYRDFLERFIVLEAGQRVGINEIEILALKTKHSDTDTIGFKFFTPYFTLSYSSDTKYSSELIEEYKNSNILILNVPFLKKEEAKDNLSVEDAIKIIKEVAPRLAIITHFGTSMVKRDPLYVIREIQKETGIQTMAAKDGMIVNPLSYSVDHGQRTLPTISKEEKIEVKDEKQEEVIEEKQAIEEIKEHIKENTQEQLQEDIKEQVKEIYRGKQNEAKEDMESGKPLKEIFKED